MAPPWLWKSQRTPSTRSSFQPITPESDVPDDALDASAEEPHNSDEGCSDFSPDNIGVEHQSESAESKNSLSRHDDGGSSSTTPNINKTGNSGGPNALITIRVDISDIISSIEDSRLAHRILGLINRRLDIENIRLEDPGLLSSLESNGLTAPPPCLGDTTDIKIQTLRACEQQLAELETAAAANPRDYLTGHLLVVLREVRAQYKESDGAIPLALMNLNHQPVPISWDSIQSLGKPGSFIDATVIDWLLCMRSEDDLSTDFLPFDCALYADTLLNASSSHSEALSPEGLRVRLRTLLSQGRVNKYASKIAIRPSASRLLFIWNPTGLHFVLVSASSSPEGARSIVVYDSFNNRNQRHRATWAQVSILHTFLEVVGLYHSPFRGKWPLEVAQGPTVRQESHDCGVFATWAARELLAGRTIPGCNDAARLGTLLRTFYVGEIRDTIEGSESGAWDSGLLSQYQSLVFQRISTSPEILNVDDTNNSSDSEYNSDVWLDEQDSTIQTLALAQNSRDVCLAILQPATKGLYPSELMAAIKIRSSALHADLPAAYRKLHDPRFIKHILQGGQNQKISAHDRYGCIIVNPGQKYKIPEIAKALFSTEKHVRDSTDDIDSSYDMVLPVFRQSVQKATNVTLKDQIKENDLRMSSLIALWNLVFNRCPSHPRLLDAQSSFDDSETECDPYWMPFSLGFRSSNKPIFEPGDSTQESVQRVAQIIQDLQAIKSGTYRVLFLFVGIDTLTTDNQSWTQLVRRFPDVDFSLTSLCPKSFSELYPSVFTTRHGFAWAHLQARELDATLRATAQSCPSLVQNPKVARWLYWLDTLFEKKVRQQNGSKEPLSELEKRLTIHRRTLLEQIVRLELQNKMCEDCASTDSDTWSRGSKSPDSVRCVECAGKSSRTTNKAGVPQAFRTQLPPSVVRKPHGSTGPPESALLKQFTKPPAPICNVPDCNNCCTIEPHHGFAICQDHIELNVIHLCQECKKMKVLHIIEFQDNVCQLCAQRQNCYVGNCHGKADAVLIGKPFCNAHTDRVRKCPTCNKCKYSSRWLLGGCEYCYKSGASRKQPPDQSKSTLNIQDTEPTRSDRGPSTNAKAGPPRNYCSVLQCMNDASTVKEGKAFCLEHEKKFGFCECCQSHKYSNKWHLKKRFCKWCYESGRHKEYLKSLGSTSADPITAGIGGPSTHPSIRPGDTSNLQMAVTKENADYSETLPIEFSSNDEPPPKRVRR